MPLCLSRILSFYCSLCHFCWLRFLFASWVLRVTFSCVWRLCRSLASPVALISSIVASFFLSYWFLISHLLYLAPSRLRCPTCSNRSCFLPSSCWRVVYLPLVNLSNLFSSWWALRKKSWSVLSSCFSWCSLTAPSFVDALAVWSWAVLDSIAI